MKPHATFVTLKLHCSFPVPRRRSSIPRPTRAVPRAVAHLDLAGTFFCFHLSKSAVTVNLNFVPFQPPNAGEERIQIGIPKLSKENNPEYKPPIFISELLQQPGGVEELAKLLKQDMQVSRQFWAHEELSAAFVTVLIAQNKVEEVEKTLSKGKPSPQALIAAAAAFTKKGSTKGLAMIERFAETRQLLSNSSSSDLWFAFIKAYGALEKLDHVKRLFKSAREAGAWSLNATPKYTNTYLNAIHSDIRLVFIRTRQLLDAGAVPDAATFNILLKSCMRAKDSNRADLAINWMYEARIQPDEVTWSSLIKVRSYTDDFEGVLAVRHSMATVGFEPTPSVWGSLLVACGVAQHHETALMLWREAKAVLGGPKNIPTNLYNAMLTACNACGQGERTLAFLEEMKVSGVQPSVKSYNLAIKACGNAGQRLRLEELAVALKLYEEMRTKKLQPDLITYGTMIELCAEGRQGALARRLYSRMEEDNVKPNVVIMTSLLKALARAGLVDDCLETFSKMVWGPARMKPNRITFKTVVRELRQAGALGAALKAYEGMRRAQHAPSNVEFQELIAAAAEAALAEGDPELQAQVASLCNIGTTLDEVDLHGMSKYEARAAVLCVLSMLMTEYHDTGLPPTSLTIITGRGEHSEGGKSILPGTIQKLLQDELHILGLANPTSVGNSSNNNSNPGRIVIEQERLLRWLRARVATRQQHQRKIKKAAAKGGTIDDY